MTSSYSFRRVYITWDRTLSIAVHRPTMRYFLSDAASRRAAFPVASPVFSDYIIDPAFSVEQITETASPVYRQRVERSDWLER